MERVMQIGRLESISFVETREIQVEKRFTESLTSSTK